MDAGYPRRPVLGFGLTGALPPIALDPVPALPALQPAAVDPDGPALRWFLPAPGDPDIFRPIPPIVTANPGVRIHRAVRLIHEPLEAHRRGCRRRRRRRSEGNEHCAGRRRGRTRVTMDAAAAIARPIRNPLPASDLSSFILSGPAMRLTARRPSTQGVPRT